MGLLDQFFGNADQTQALGLLGAGLMAGNPAAGFGSASTLLGAAPDRALHRQMTQAQLENFQMEMQQRKLAMENQQRWQSMLFGGGGADTAPAVSPGAFAPSADGMGPTMPPSMAVLAQPRSKIGNMSIDDVAAIEALGGPKLMDAFKWANDPMKLEQGSTYRDRITGQERFMPKTDNGIAPDRYGFYNALPGYAAAQGSIAGAQTGAQEAAKDPYAPLVTVNTPDGPKLMTAAQARAYAGGPPSAPTAPSKPTLSREQFNSDPTVQNWRETTRLAQDGPAYANLAGLRGQTAGVPGGALKTPAQEAADAASKASLVKSAEATAADVADTRKGIMNAGFAAPTTIAKYQQLGKLLKDVDGGTLTNMGTELASTANSLGLKIDKNLPNKEAAASLANEMALELRSPANGAGMPGSLSDQDRKFLVGMVPNASQTTQGRQQLIDAKIAIESRKQQVATFARNYEKKYGRLDNGFFEQMQAWANANPLFGGK